MKKYVKRPIPIHAFRWDGDPVTIYQNVSMEDSQKYFELFNTPDGYKLRLKSLEGVENCPIGDFVIRGVHGEYYPCYPNIFKESYKEVE